jgi:hypothetical protein
VGGKVGKGTGVGSTTESSSIPIRPKGKKFTAHLKRLTPTNKSRGTGWKSNSFYIGGYNKLTSFITHTHK